MKVRTFTLTFNNETLVRTEGDFFAQDAQQLVKDSKKHNADPSTVATPPADSVALPPGRKDLPPMTPVATVAVPGPAGEPVSADVPTPSSLPSGRVPTSEGRDKPSKPAAGGGAAATAGKLSKPGQPAAPTPAPKPDDLSNIGRR